jgi:hypothetical protein
VNEWLLTLLSAVANGNTGSTIYVGAPIGTAAGLTVLLNGKAPPLNECGSEETCRKRVLRLPTWGGSSVSSSFSASR